MLIWSNILLESCLIWGEGWLDYVQNLCRDSAFYVFASYVQFCSCLQGAGCAGMLASYWCLNKALMKHVYICFFLFVMSLLVSHETQNGGVTSSAHTPNMYCLLSLICVAKPKKSTLLHQFCFHGNRVYHSCMVTDRRNCLAGRGCHVWNNHVSLVQEGVICVCVSIYYIYFWRGM